MGKGGTDIEGEAARAAAVDEMLLRLRWDDRDKGARIRLSMIVSRIWDGLEGIESGKPIPSALWLTDDRGQDARLSEVAPSRFSPPERGERCDSQSGSSEGVGDDWKVI